MAPRSKSKNNQQWHIPPTTSQNTNLDTMPSTSNQAPVPDFSKRCHYTLQLYSCGHKTWLNHPRIRHIYPYCLFANATRIPAHQGPTDDIIFAISGLELPTTSSEEHQKKFSKTRCTNMASKPREFHLIEVCGKCRPVGLGVRKGLREYEGLVGDFRHLSLDDKSKGDEGKVVKKPEILEEVKAGNTRAKEVEIRDEVSPDAKSPTKLPAQHGDKKSHIQAENAIEREVSRNSETKASVPIPEMTTKPRQPRKQQSFMANMMGIFMPSWKQGEPQSSIKREEDKEPLEIWVDVGEDPDWDMIDAKEARQEGKEELWKDDGDWVNVQSQ